MKGKSALKSINLLSLVSSKKNLAAPVFKSYISHFGINIKDDEIEDIRLLIIELMRDFKEIEILEGFYVGYIIKQIGKEFDLLRFGESNIINVELKKKNTGDRMKKQLIKNKYYLSFTGKKVLNFTYVSEDNKLYFLDENEEFTETKFSTLIAELLEQKLIEIEDINKMFDPSNYLVSPFNSTEAFIEDQYFLTDHQMSFKNSILKLNNQTGACFISIDGQAGTGKTLLTYDIAKEYINNQKTVLIFHCGTLNSGHDTLRDRYSWEVSSIKNYDKYDFSDYELIILDETQRIRRNQLEDFLLQAKKTKKKYIFSYDSQQCLASWEIRNNIPQYLKDEVSPTHFKLTEKIRTNKEIASFIKNLFNLANRSPKQVYTNIDVQYFVSIEAVQKEIEILKHKGWKIINYTPSRYSYFPYDKYQNHVDDSAHKVIGQEFDNVVAIIDKHFYYNEGKLSTQGWSSNPYYHPTKMLFQILTRARKKLYIIILNNEKVLDECLSILHQNQKS